MSRPNKFRSLLYSVHLGVNPSRSPRAEAVLAAESPALPVVEATPTSPKRRRLTTSKVVVELSHCSRCGSTQHQAPTCPMVAQKPEPSEAVVRSRKAFMLRTKTEVEKRAAP